MSRRSQDFSSAATPPASETTPSADAIEISGGPASSTGTPQTARVPAVEPAHTSRYPLGTDQEEFERLQFQHRLWADAAHGLWQRAQIAPGFSVLDLGAGPGAASFDLAALVTSSGRVVAVDESQHFMSYLQREATDRGLPQLHAVACDVQALSKLPLDVAPPKSFDLAYARWLLCFTQKPETVVAQTAELLKPGGMFAVHDYFNYATMTPGPRRVSYTRVVEATAQSWRERGGDPDVVARLPAACDDAGLEVVHLAVHQRIARPGDTMWFWASTWWRSYTPKLVAMGYVEPRHVEEFDRDLAAMTRERDFLVLPPVYELLAKKR